MSKAFEILQQYALPGDLPDLPPPARKEPGGWISSEDGPGGYEKRYYSEAQMWDYAREAVLNECERLALVAEQTASRLYEEAGRREAAGYFGSARVAIWKAAGARECMTAIRSQKESGK